MNVQQLFFIAAAVCFLLDAFRVAARVSWTPLGFALLTIALWLL